MANAVNYGGGWLGDRSSGTGAATGWATKVLIATTMLVSQGTGAFLDNAQSVRQYRNNDNFISLSRLPIVEIEPTRTPAEDLDRIRDVLSPSISTLADIFGVTRQAIYNWLKGERLKSEHLAKLKDLAQAADLLADAGITATGALLKRKLVEGKNIFEISRAGGSARDAVLILVQIVQREQQQRELLNSRLAGRKSPSRSAESDFPAEND
jgi:transcriptional regulator with XRE-family HTH domain